MDTGILIVQFSCSVLSDSLQPHGLQHAMLPCPSPTPGACSKSCPLSRWCHPITSSCLQSFPASGSFLMSQFFTSGGQSFGVWASASVLPVNIQDWFPLGLSGLQSRGLPRVFSNTTVQKHQLLRQMCLTPREKRQLCGPLLHLLALHPHPVLNPLALACCPQAPWLRVPYSSTRTVFQDYGLNLGRNHGSSKGPQEKTDSTAFTEKHIGMLDTGWMA